LVVYDLHIGEPPTAPRNLTVLSNSTHLNFLVVNLTWTPPEHTHGQINFYIVEFYFNNTAAFKEKTIKVQFCYFVNVNVLTKDAHFNTIKHTNRSVHGLKKGICLQKYTIVNMKHYTVTLFICNCWYNC